MANHIRIVNNFVLNPIDTVALRRYAFPGNRLFSNMITRYINIPYFIVAANDTTITRGIVLNMYARGRCTLERWTASTSQRTITALEAIAPNLPLLLCKRSRSKTVSNLINNALLIQEWCHF